MTRLTKGSQLLSESHDGTRSRILGTIVVPLALSLLPACQVQEVLRANAETRQALVALKEELGLSSRARVAVRVRSRKSLRDRTCSSTSPFLASEARSLVEQRLRAEAQVGASYDGEHAREGCAAERVFSRRAGPEPGRFCQEAYS